MLSSWILFRALHNSNHCNYEQICNVKLFSGLHPCFVCSDLTVQFNSATYTVFESNGNVTLTLKTDKPFEYPFTVDVSTADGTAVGELHTMFECFITTLSGYIDVDMSDYHLREICNLFGPELCFWPM